MTSLAMTSAPWERASTLTVPVPPVPKTIEDTGLSVDQLEQLTLKTMYGGEATGHSIAEHMRLPTRSSSP
jgi:hypothetical protein